jgi:hypothetical protein
MKRKYVIIRGDSLQSLSDLVNTKMEEGYIPHGSVVAPSGLEYLQPMVLKMKIGITCAG